MRRFKIFSILFIVLFTYSLFADINKESAINIVLNEVIQNQIDSVNVYMDSLIVTTDEYVLTSYKSISNPFDQSWTFFIDDNPLCYWEHPCRYIFINVSNGNFQILAETTPIFNYEKDLEEISIALLPTESSYSNEPVIIQRSRTPDPHKWAIFICGQAQVSTWNGMSSLYCALTLEENGMSYNYSDSNIIVLSDDGLVNNEEGGNQFTSFYGPADNSNHIDNACSKNNIIAVFNNLANILGPEDMLLIYVTGHGGYDETIGKHFTIIRDEEGDLTRLFDDRLQKLIDPINCAQTIITMTQCKSGGFIDELQAPNRLIITATDGLAYSTGSHSLYSTHPANNFPEFAYFWSTSIRQKHPDDWQAPWDFDENVGENPFFINTYLLPDFDPDFSQSHSNLDPTLGNSDGIIQMGEAFQYAKAMDAFVEDFYIYENDGRNEYPQFSNGSAFIEDVYSLHGVSGKIVNTQSIHGNFHIGGELQISENTTLTIQSGSFIFLNNDSQIIVDENSSLIIQDNVIIKGNCPDNSIQVYGNMQIGNNVKFTSTEGTSWNGLNIYNSNPVILRNTIFENCRLICDQTKVFILESQFINSDIVHTRASINIDQSDFNNSFITGDATGGIYIENPQFIFNNNTVFNTNRGTSLKISFYGDYEIINNVIDCNGIGIDIIESGSGLKQSIRDNEIFGTPYGCAIRLYHSYAYIKGSNEIYNKSECLIGYNNSEISILGNTDIPYQTFRNAPFSEFRFTSDSFPSILRYNEIYDDNHNYDLLFSSGFSQTSRRYDVRYNYWGTNFDPTLDFYPQDAYLFNPQWDLDGLTPDASELLFIQAEQYELSGNFNLARQTYKSIIEIYPESSFAKSSTKKLFSLEKKLDYSRNSPDYMALKIYYETEENMSFDAEILHLSEDLANYCDIELANYESAIAYNESIVANPPSLQDSVFAVIDAGYVYLLMEYSGRANYVGLNSELKPKSKKELDLKRDKLLLLLHQSTNEGSNQSEDMHSVSLNSNFPNPFNPSTTISFTIPESSKIKVTIYNVKGQKVKSLTNKYYERGIHKLTWQGEDDSDNQVSSGIYFYKLAVNGNSKAIKKCLLLK